MKKFIFAASVFLCNVSFAQGIWVEGVADCGQWLNARSDSRAQYFEHLLIGLVNGMAIGRTIDIWRVNGVAVSRDQLYYWIDGYCKKLPLESIFSGAIVFADERTSGAYSKKVLTLK